MTGHSLGGALATLFAAHLHILNYQVDTFYTYGSPRIGNSDFADAVSLALPHHNRIVNDNDMVTHVPPAWWFFKHVGKRIQYEDDETTYMDCRV